MISVIVTCYNYGHFLMETLQSIKDQTFSDWECIVVDSGSTDNSGDVVKQFEKSDKRFKYIFKADEGVSAARNAGLKICKGEYIQFIDGDDQIEENKLQSQVDAFSKNPKADIIYGDVRFYDNGNKDVLRTSLKGDKPDNWMPRISGSGDVVFQLLKRFNFLVTLSPLLKRSVIAKTGGFNEGIPALEDWDFWQRCALSNFYFHFNQSENDLSLVRVHEASLSKRRELMLLGNFYLLRNRINDSSVHIKDKLFFLFKYVELFWDTAFSGNKLPRSGFILFALCALFFPFWILIKLYRLR